MTEPKIINNFQYRLEPSFIKGGISLVDSTITSATASKSPTYTAQNKA